MLLHHSRIFIVVAAVAMARVTSAQDATASIEQSRLYQQTPTPTSRAVNADGMALGASEDTSDDDSFGSQQILKNQERPKRFAITADVASYYTSNVALTRRDVHEDEFVVGNVGTVWSSPIANRLEAQLAAHGTIFRYNNTPALDFQSVGVGAGLSWSPANFAGGNVFARYDFTDLTNRHGNQLLDDHEFTIGAQKVFAFGRAHSLIAGAFASAGVSDPFSAQRDQLGVFVGYHLQITRKLDTDIGYRVAGYFYNDAGRTDANQLFSWRVRYRVTDYVDLNGSFSFADNRSTRSVFDYDAATAGVAVGFSLRF